MNDELLKVEQEIKEKRAEMNAVRDAIEILQNKAIGLLPFKVGDVVEHKGNYNVGFWRIEFIKIDDDFFGRDGRLNRTLSCINIKADGKVGARTTRFRDYNDVDYLGDYETWLKTR